MDSNESMNNTYVNFTYKTPHEDFFNCQGINADGSVNIKYTLLNLRNMLSENIKIITMLMEKSDHILALEPVGYNELQISFSSKEVEDEMLNNNVISKMTGNNSGDDDVILNIFSDSDEETNQDRLRSINNIVSQNDMGMIFKVDSKSDSESDTILDDEENTKTIIKKYLNYCYDPNASADLMNSSDEDFD